MIERDKELLRKVRAAGVRFTVEGDRLKYRAPAGAITPEIKAALAELKPTVLYEYHERAGIMEYHGNLPREEAEARASEILKGERVT